MNPDISKLKKNINSEVLTVVVYIFAVDTFMGGESIYIGALINTLARVNSVSKIFVLINNRTDRNIVDKKYPLERVSYLNYCPFIKRFDNSLLNKIKKIILFIGLISGLIRFFKRPIINRTKYRHNTLIVSPYIAPDLLLFSFPSIVNPQDFRSMYEQKSTFNPLKAFKKIVSRTIYTSVLKNSFIVVDSKQNERDLYKFYYKYVKNSMIIRSLPDFEEIDNIRRDNKSETYIQIVNKYKLFREYLFYPAHLIPDNNHLNLLEALYIIKQKYNIEVNIILSGGRDDLKMDILKKVENCGLNVKYLNYISYSEIVILMLNAKGLVFPSFIGPSLCIWEAFYLRVPVISSNVCTLAEQVGDAGLLFDPNNFEDLAEKIYRIWTDENLRREIIQKGYDRIKDITLEKYTKQWEQVIEEALNMREL